MYLFGYYSEKSIVHFFVFHNANFICNKMLTKNIIRTDAYSLPNDALRGKTESNALYCRSLKKNECMLVSFVRSLATSLLKTRFLPYTKTFQCKERSKLKNLIFAQQYSIFVQIWKN